MYPLQQHPLPAEGQPLSSVPPQNVGIEAGGSEANQPSPPAAPPIVLTEREMQKKVDDFLSSFSRQRAKGTLLIRIGEGLDLHHAGPEKFAKIPEIMETISNDPNRPTSASKAGDQLIN